MPDETNPYDKVLYPSYTRQQSHPDRLATIGKLLGMKPAPVQRCRVLELGCGNGSNLVPMAFSLSESEFVGVDLAGTPIANARRMAEEIGLTNVTFHQRNVVDVTRELGTFDYLICHGVFSWAPEEARDAILRICHENLSPHGIAFVSYNAYPGNRLREMIREMMLFHIKGFDDPKEQIEQAQALASFVAEAQDESDLYRKFLKEEMEMFMRFDGNYLFHDSLADYNTPFYFAHFINLAEGHALQYLGEADFHSMLDTDLPKNVIEKLDELAGDRVSREQYLDFLRCRRFRQTLLCHEDLELDLSLNPAVIADFYVAGLVHCAAANPQPGVKVQEAFENRRGARIQTDAPLAKSAFKILNAEWPQAIGFAELLERARAEVSAAGQWTSAHPAQEERELQMILFRSFGVGLIDLHTVAARRFSAVTTQPRATKLARWQAANQKFVTTHFHGSAPMEDPVARHLVSLLDGTRDRAALVRELGQGINQRRQKDGVPGTDFSDDTKASALLAQALDENLAKMSKLGLLEA